MTTENGKLIAISECDICYHLAEIETSFFKLYHEDETRLLPPEAALLLAVSTPSSEDRNKYDYLRCPVCGTFYRSHMSYEFLIGGSEDEEELRRLTPSQARPFLTDAEYKALIEWMQVCLQHTNAMTRRYAAKCLVSHHLERHEMTLIVPYLTHDDDGVVSGALNFFHQVVMDNDDLRQLLALQNAFVELGDHPEKTGAKSARFIAQCLARYAKHFGLQE